MLKYLFTSFVFTLLRMTFFSFRYIFPDIRLEWGDGLCQVRPVPQGSAEAPHGSVRGTFVRLHGALCENMLPSAGDYTNLLQITARVPLKRLGSYSACRTESVLSVLCQKKILLNTFLDVLMADPPPQCLVWLPLMHRLANVENGTSCFRGFFYICFASANVSEHCKIIQNCGIMLLPHCCHPTLRSVPTNSVPPYR